QRTCSRRRRALPRKGAHVAAMSCNLKKTSCATSAIMASGADKGEITVSLSEVEKSRHESSHALFAHAHGMAVEWVSVRPKAETLVTVAFAPEDLPENYRLAPRNTLVIMGDVVAMIMAGGMSTDNVLAGKD